MSLLFSTLLAIGLVPLALGFALSKPAPLTRAPVVRVGSVFLCALAFNLTFFWQELWLVIPKALTPGLHPVLFHNNHDWTGERPVAELLQGTGAIATLVSGLTFGSILTVSPTGNSTWRLFLFWMAFEGLVQSLTQVVIGAMVPGNDVGRAFAYLHFTAAAEYAVLGMSLVLLGAAGAVLAHIYPFRSVSTRPGRDRAFTLQILFTALAATAVIAPFRLPRSFIEVLIVPFFVNLIGVGWLVFGAAVTRCGNLDEGDETVGVAVPALALMALLLVFQLVLRRGVPFG